MGYTQVGLRGLRSYRKEVAGGQRAGQGSDCLCAGCEDWRTGPDEQ